MSQYYGVRSWDSVKHTETWSRGLGTVRGVPELCLGTVLSVKTLGREVLG